MSEVYVFKIVGDWQVVPTASYELDFCKNEVVIRPVSIVTTKGESDDKEFRIKWDLEEDHLWIFSSAKEAVTWIKEKDLKDKKEIEKQEKKS
eukprot:TRINITY_DN855_c0_g1_i2.p1 TRINITY_DN855_c0_g1~~TRINITY_DN855_c0_g1_i2.p1  ORF type:complete len:104 (-),score=30.67 TRINITY_DN855_c0_g1_i2:47-322(-)